MQSLGYGPLDPTGAYLLASLIEKNGVGPAHIGQIRVYFEYDRCSNATIVA